ncbi:unnamed protein product, partial [Notodromas monacha]
MHVAQCGVPAPEDLVDHDEFYSINLPELLTWQELQQKSFLKSSPTTSACFPEFQMIRTNEAVNFAREHKLSKVLDGIPGYLYFMSHIHATEDTDSKGKLPHRRKCIHDLNSVITLEYHGGRSCLFPEDGSYRPCTTRIINGNVMQSFHYRSKCTSTSGDLGILFFPCDLTRAKYDSLAIRNNAETVRHLLESYENIPDAVFDLSQSSGKPSRSSLKFPTLYDIHISNKMYQVSETEVCTILIKTCHLDEREPTGPVVRCVTSVEFKAEFHAE